MEQDYKNKILTNIDKLIKYTNYDILIQECRIRQIFQIDVLRQIESVPTELERHRQIFLHIVVADSNTYQSFLEILNELFKDADSILTHVVYCNEFRTLNRAAKAFTERPTNIVNNNNQSHNEMKPSTSSSMLSSQSLSIDNSRTKLEEFKEQVNPEHTFMVKYSTKFYGDNTGKIGFYPMRSHKRGILILINNIHFNPTYNGNSRRRNGAETDRDNIVHLFRQMGFFICVKEDLTRKEFYEFLDNVRLSKDVRQYDCFMFAVFSHGVQNEVEFKDGNVDVEFILERFNNHHCQALVQKPKIFIFPFCRGTLKDHGVTGKKGENVSCISAPVEVVSGTKFGDMKIISNSYASRTMEIRRQTERDGLGNEAMPNISTFYDMKICYSTVSGYTAFHDPENGSWYVEILCKIFAEHAHDTHIENLLKMIGLKMNEKRNEWNQLQTTSNEDRGFNKKLYFNPGYYGEENSEQMKSVI